MWIRQAAHWPAPHAGRPRFPGRGAFFCPRLQAGFPPGSTNSIQLWIPTCTANTMDKPRLGFIGLGIMGQPMCANLINAGYSLTVWNRSRPGIDTVVGYGAQAAGSPAEVAEQSDVIITIVTDSPDVEKVVLSENGVI